MNKVGLLILMSITWIDCFSFSNSELVEHMNHYLNGLATSSADHSRTAYSDSLEQLLLDALVAKDSYEFDYSEIKQMGVVKSPDEAFQLFNWNIPKSKGGSNFKCLVVIPGERLNKVISLEQVSRPLKKISTRTVEPDAWYGALYYEIIPIKKGKKFYYTLLGYSQYSKSISKKFIDVLNLRDGEITFGAPVFKTAKGTKKRVVFEYSAEVSMSLRWLEDQNRIVADHLSPRSPEFEGNLMFYGPDGTFNAYNLEKSIWEFEEDVDFRSKTKSKKPFKDPRIRKRG